MSPDTARNWHRKSPRLQRIIRRDASGIPEVGVRALEKWAEQRVAYAGPWGTGRWSGEGVA